LRPKSITSILSWPVRVIAGPSICVDAENWASTTSCQRRYSRQVRRATFLSLPITIVSILRLTDPWPWNRQSMILLANAEQTACAFFST
jgi:hypothetical protein